MKEIKEQIYADLVKTLGEIDGQNKEGIFFTIDGQQYNLKLTAKKKPIIFSDSLVVSTDSNLSIDLNDIEITAEDLEKIEKIFQGEIDYV